MMIIDAKEPQRLGKFNVLSIFIMLLLLVLHFYHLIAKLHESRRNF